MTGAWCRTRTSPGTRSRCPGAAWSAAVRRPTPVSRCGDGRRTTTAGRPWATLAGHLPSCCRSWSPLQRAFADAAATVGHAVVGDHNLPGAVGIGPGPRNVHDGLRMSSALTHLAAARGRPNLTIRPGTVVDRVELRGTTTRGIRTADGEIVESDVVVLASGSYASPVILMRSGIGPAAGLRGLGIRVTADLAGVGGNLIDHPLAAVDLPTSSGYAGPRFQMMLTMRSRHARPDGPPDLHLFAAGPFDDDASPSGGVFGIV